MNPLFQLKTTSLPILSALTLSCFALSPRARATCQDACLTNNNTVQGDDALINNVFGSDSTAIGFEALFSSTNSSFNTAIGSQALSGAGSCEANTAIGYKALVENTTGGFNTAVGQQALSSNTTAFNNTAIGTGALFGNTIGGDNTASGDDALVSNTTGNRNTGNGGLALYNNTIGNNNTAVGYLALDSNTIGSRNVALGFKAGHNLTTGNRNIDISNTGVADESGTIRIGSVGDQTATFIAGISGATVPTGVAVIVDSSGHLGTTTSSARFKDEIKPMDEASEAILALKPVTFRYKHELDPAGIPQFGLVAEEVEKVNPDLVARDNQGKPYTVRYDAVNAMLLNEFLKEHRTVEELKKEIAALTATVKEQESQIQKVSAELATASLSGDGLEATKSSPQIVLNNR
jgi:hypothetical protein